MIQARIDRSQERTSEPMPQDQLARLRSGPSRVYGTTFPLNAGLWFENSHMGAGTQLPQGQTIEIKKSNYSPVVGFSGAAQKQERFRSLHKWQGFVISASAGSFLARISDVTGRDPDEEVEFSLDEVPPPDLPLLQPGAVFYWIMGYLDTRNGQRLRTSAIRFRRLPIWTDDELSKAQFEAQNLRKDLGWD